MRFRLESRIVSHHASGTTGGTSGATAGGFAGAGTGNSEILKGVARWARDEREVRFESFEKRGLVLHSAFGLRPSAFYSRLRLPGFRLPACPRDPNAVLLREPCRETVPCSGLTSWSRTFDPKAGSPSNRPSPTLQNSDRVLREPFLKP